MTTPTTGPLPEDDTRTRLGRAIGLRWRRPGPPPGRLRPAPIGSLASASARFALGTGRPVGVRRALMGPASGPSVARPGAGALVAPPRWWSRVALVGGGAEDVSEPRGLPRAVQRMPAEGDPPRAPGGVRARLRGQTINVRVQDDVRAAGRMMTATDARMRRSASAPPARPSGSRPGNEQGSGRTSPLAPLDGREVRSPASTATSDAGTPGPDGRRVGAPQPDGRLARRRILATRAVAAGRRAPDEPWGVGTRADSGPRRMTRGVASDTTASRGPGASAGPALVRRVTTPGAPASVGGALTSGTVPASLAAASAAATRTGGSVATGIAPAPRATTPTTDAAASVAGGASAAGSAAALVMGAGSGSLRAADGAVGRIGHPSAADRPIGRAVPSGRPSGLPGGELEPAAGGPGPAMGDRGPLAGDRGPSAGIPRALGRGLATSTAGALATASLPLALGRGLTVRRSLGHVRRVVRRATVATQDPTAPLRRAVAPTPATARAVPQPPLPATDAAGGAGTRFVGAGTGASAAVRRATSPRRDTTGAVAAAVGWDGRPPGGVHATDAGASGAGASRPDAAASSAGASRPNGPRPADPARSGGDAASRASLAGDLAHAARAGSAPGPLSPAGLGATASTAWFSSSGRSGGPLWDAAVPGHLPGAGHRRPGRLVGGGRALSGLGLDATPVRRATRRSSGMSPSATAVRGTVRPPVGGRPTEGPAGRGPAFGAARAGAAAGPTGGGPAGAARLVATTAPTTLPGRNPVMGGRTPAGPGDALRLLAPVTIRPASGSEAALGVPNGAANGLVNGVANGVATGAATAVAAPPVRRWSAARPTAARPRRGDAAAAPRPSAPVTIGAARSAPATAIATAAGVAAVPAAWAVQPPRVRATQAWGAATPRGAGGGATTPPGAGPSPSMHRLGGPAGPTGDDAMTVPGPRGEPSPSPASTDQVEAGVLARIGDVIDARLDARLDAHVMRLIDERLQEETERRGWRRYGEVF